MVNITLTFEDHGLAAAFKRKAGEVDGEVSKLTRDLTDIAQRWVQNEAPRRTGKLKTAVEKKSTSTTGLVWVNKARADYAYHVIFGTKPHKITARNKKALNVPGFGIFKSVMHPGTKSNPFVDKGAKNMMGEFNKRVSIFENWLGDI